MNSIAIISTGEELVNGFVTDTNSQKISNSLFQYGFSISCHSTTGDNPEQLVTIIQQVLSYNDIIVISGGLGPTDDDNTIAALQHILKFDVTVDNNSLEKMKVFFDSYPGKISIHDEKMVQVPVNAVIFENKCGLAPGFVIYSQGKTIIAVPGVPHEMESMLKNSVIPYLQKKFHPVNRETISFNVTGLKESEVNMRVNNMNLDLHNIYFGITANNGIMTVRFSKKGQGTFNKTQISEEIRNYFQESLIGIPFSTPEEELINLLIQSNLTIGVAESCTGGLIAKRLTDIPGSSGVFQGGVVAYNNEVKIKQLAVSGNSLSEFGAVSEQVANEMARGIKENFNTDICIATTGIAGPGGGSQYKPVGTVCFGFIINHETCLMTKHFPGARDRVRNNAALYAINYIRKKLLQKL